MRKLVLLATLASLVACESSRDVSVKTKDGIVPTPIKCVGVNGKGKVPGIDYDYSVRNIALGVLFFGFVLPPIKVVLTEIECPIGDTTSSKQVTP